MTEHQQEPQPPGDTSSEELDRRIGAAAEAARMLVDSRPSDRAAWLEQVATRLDAAAEDLVDRAQPRRLVAVQQAADHPGPSRRPPAQPQDRGAAEALEEAHRVGRDLGRRDTVADGDPPAHARAPQGRSQVCTGRPVAAASR